MAMEYFKNCMTKEQLEQEHRRLVKQLHPDRNPNNPNATAEFQEMQAQYEERLAELNGDYTKARKGRERREREERERQEREAKERERRKVEHVIEQARANKTKPRRDLKAGDYVYARMVNFNRLMFDWDHMSTDDLLHVAMKQGVNDECVVMIEQIVELSDIDLMRVDLSNHLPEGIWGGYEVLQNADPNAGVKKARRVAKVVMFRSEMLCVFGNPKGDHIISDYYLPYDFGMMFHTEIDDILCQMEYERKEKERIEAERKAKLLAEQKPLIEEWQEKLIAISAGLSDREKQEVAVANLKTMLKAKFPGTTFKFRTDKYSGGYYDIQWEDGPTVDDVDAVQRLFDPCIKYEKNLTPWEERFGHVYISGFDRKMSTLTKAKILQQLGSVTEAFRNGAINDEVTVTDFDWMMLHLLVGIKVGDHDAKLCQSTPHADGTRSVNILLAVRFIFNHTSYAKQVKAAKKKTV